MVCIWLPSRRGMVSCTTVSPSSSTRRSRMTRPQFGVRHLAAAEEDGGLYLVAVGQEPFHVLLLEPIVVLVHLRAELDFLDLDRLLVLLGLPGALVLQVLVAAIVGDTAHRRHRGGGDLDEVESLGPRNDQCLLRRHHAELLAGIVDHANLAYTNPLVGPRAVAAEVALRSSCERYDNLPSGALHRISSRAAARNAPTGCAPRSPPPRARTATAPAAVSRSPATSM